MPGTNPGRSGCFFIGLARQLTEEGPMIPLHRAWVIAVLSLLTSAVMAHAECAWVLSSNPAANVHMVESGGPFVGDGV
jgi:hypothetical protein